MFLTGMGYLKADSIGPDPSHSHHVCCCPGCCQGYCPVAPKKAIDITMIVDCSGSMGPMAAQVIKSYNSFITEQKTIDGKATMTLVQFNHEYKPIYAGKDLLKTDQLNSDSYVAGGYTALFDAIGKAITDAKARLYQQDVDVVFVITTDGLENASKEYSGEQIRSMIAECESEYGWHFMFLASNITAFNQRDGMGLQWSSSFCSTPTEKGYEDSQKLVEQQILRFRKSGNAKDLDFNDKDRVPE